MNQNINNDQLRVGVIGTGPVGLILTAHLKEAGALVVPCDVFQHKIDAIRKKGIRLTHTIEVAQISRTIARMLGLNEDLAEAVALAHDLGHTPFGHSGEKALNRILTGSEPAVSLLAARLPELRGQ